MALAGLAVLLVAAVGFSGALASNTHNKPSSSIKKSRSDPSAARPSTSTP
jgi:hypothetical protein